MNPSRPRLFIMGAVKAGTTSLHAYLAQHPHIRMSRVKWTRYFHVAGGAPDFPAMAARYGPTHLAESEARYRVMIHNTVPTTLADYESLWPAAAPGVVLGDASPTYMYDTAACEQIRRQYPDARIIVVLREPVSRALSHFAMDHANGWTTHDALMDAVRNEPAGIGNFWWGASHYVRHGHYGTRLAMLRTVFAPKQLKVMLYDDLCADPLAFLNEITAWLGLEPHPFDVTLRHNEAPEAKPALSVLERQNLARLFGVEMATLRSQLGRTLPGWP